VRQPIHVEFVAQNGGPSMIAHPRVLIVLGASSQASIVETYAGPAGARYFTNTVAEIVLGENASLDHYKLQYESDEAYHVGAIHVRAERSARCTSHSISIGGVLVRNDVVAVLDGEGVDDGVDAIRQARSADGRMAAAIAWFASCSTGWRRCPLAYRWMAATVQADICCLRS
jgi:Fe-S cluster assembly protein SufD